MDINIKGITDAISITMVILPSPVKIVSSISQTIKNANKFNKIIIPYLKENFHIKQKTHKII